MDAPSIPCSQAANNKGLAPHHHHPQHPSAAAAVDSSPLEPLHLQIPLRHHHQHQQHLRPNSSQAAPSSSTTTGMLASFYNSLHLATQQRGSDERSQSSPKHSTEERWYSLEGYLSLKTQGGALNFLNSKKRFYFGLNELANSIVYYKDKGDFDRRRDCLGTISLGQLVCSLVDGNRCAFTLHSPCKKQYLLEADNEKCAGSWLRALQQRRESCMGEQLGSSGELPLIIADPACRHRSRSRSLPSSEEEKSLSAMRPTEESVTLRRPPPPLHLQVDSDDSTPIAEESSKGFSTAPFVPPPTPLLERSLQHSVLHASEIFVNGTQNMTSQCSGTDLDARSTQGSSQCYGGEKSLYYQSAGGTYSFLVAPQEGMVFQNRMRNSSIEYGLRRPSGDVHLANGYRNGGDLLGDAGCGAVPLPEIALTSTPPRTPFELMQQGTETISPERVTEGSEVDSTITSRCDSRVSAVNLSYGALDAADECAMLRLVNNVQKERNQELNDECNRWRFETERWKIEAEKTAMQVAASKIANGTVNGQPPPTTTQHPQLAMLDPISSLSAQNRFLNSEVLRLYDRLTEAYRQNEEITERWKKCEGEIDDYKKEYVFVLQSCVRIPLHEHSSVDLIQVKLFGQEGHEKRVKLLLEQARTLDHNLPTFESLTQKGTYYVDIYGFRHTFEEVSLALQYIATQLNEHYDAQTPEYKERKRCWYHLLEQSPEHIEKNRENRHLCRLGIPRSFRSRVWTVLIQQQVQAIKAKYGEYYYRNLCGSQGTTAEKHYCSTHQKQINLDLLRTMPGNVHFAAAGCKGITQLQAVLRAYCLHNPNIGYCQGMNFLAATALLFVSPENAFWFLVAITERYFDPSYFDQSLTGAQADQEVLKEIVEQKYPRLAQHLEDCEIDLTTITLNWFLALFFDAVPFQTMLRIWDCFLFEGPKVLFRFTIALLGLYEEEILNHSDTISVMKLLKAAVRVTHDVDGLIRTAFEELNPFPSKQYLRNRQAQFLEVLHEKLQQRQQLRNILNVASLASSNSVRVCDLPIETITFNEYQPGCGYVCAGNQRRGKLAMVTFLEGAANLNLIEIEFDCRPISMVICKKDMAFVSLLSGYVVSLSLKENQAEILWELKLNDVALKLLHCDNRLYCPSANGTLSVLENGFEGTPSNLDLIHIPISAAPIADAALDGDFLYLAVACKVVILNKQNLSTIGNFYVASSAAGSHIPMFEQIRALSHSQHGLWLITAHSSLIQMWREGECQLLFDITYDHSHRKPSFDEEDQFEQVEAYSVMYHEGEVWIGTVDGYLMLYRFLDQPNSMQSNPTAYAAMPVVEASVEIGEGDGSPTSGDSSPDYSISESGAMSISARRYPPGKRLSPIRNLSANSLPLHRQQMYYIPTQAETQAEESNARNEFPDSERQTRKISVKIDKITGEYAVNVKPIGVAPISKASPLASIQAATPSPYSTKEPKASTDSGYERAVPDGATNWRRRNTLCKGTSVDSAVSVFTSPSEGGGFMSNPPSSRSNDSGCVLQRNRRDAIRRTRSLKIQLMSGEKRSTAMASTTSTGGHSHQHHHRSCTNEATPVGDTPLFSMGSLEYDDCFEMYPESVGQRCNGNGAGALTPFLKLPLEGRGAKGGENGRIPSDMQLPAASASYCPTPSIASSSPPSACPTPATADTVECKAEKMLEHASEDQYQPPFPHSPAEKKDSSAFSSPAAELITLLSSNSALRIRRKDLDLDDAILGTTSENARSAIPKVSCISVGEVRKNSRLTYCNSNNEIEEKEIKSSYTMQLQMKLKISDRPVKCITLTRFNEEDVVLTGAGNYGDEEAVLRWRREKNSGLWINDPLVDMCVRGKKRTLITMATKQPK